MLRLAWLPIAQHVFQPALTGRLKLISRKLSPVNRNKGYRGEQISRKFVSQELNARSYRDFAKNIALLGATPAKFAKSVGKNMGSNMRPRYIQFCDIHDRDISGLHCISSANALEIPVLHQASNYWLFTFDLHFGYTSCSSPTHSSPKRSQNPLSACKYNVCE